MASPESNTKVIRTPKKPHVVCEVCWDDMPKAHKIFKGVAFCSTCYVREFKKAACRICQGPARVHRSELLTPVCRRCHSTARRCLRCRRPVPKAGLIFGGRPVCPSCSPHFRPRQKKNYKNHGTCMQCHKHRRVAVRFEDGRSVCVKCHGKDRTEEIRATELRYANASLDRKASFAEGVLEKDWCKRLWRDFVEWARTEIGPTPTGHRVTRYLDAFMIFDQKCSTLEDIDADLIGEVMTAEQQRRHWRVMEFLTHRDITVPSAQQKEAASEEARINRLLEQIRHTPHVDVAREFVSKMRERVAGGDLTLRSLRLNLRATLGLVETAGHQAIGQEHVLRYLRQRPGQRAALASFIGFLRCRNIDLALPTARRRPAESHSLPDNAYRIWSEAIRSGDLGQAAAATSALLMYTLAPSLEKLRSMPRGHVQLNDGIWSIQLDKVRVPLDVRLNADIDAYIRLRDTECGRDGYLFPGRPFSQPMSSAGLNYFLKRWNTPVRSLTRPALQDLKHQLAALSVA